MALILPTKTPAATRDAIIEWLKDEAGFHRDTARFCSGKRAQAARLAEADLVASLAESLAKYRTPDEAKAAAITSEPSA
ncbi:hypothetical protein ASF22_02595 [Methylobacterium sp. Leaf87]|uniref:hypothetical protein n=1 Tax=Methylobacterium sp. Leaf87 TaxID=1736243 RepID=UPI0006F31D83|nr:hypothetical protein [Methylobacterium sp. Leaf87]KQO69516.1 hypothetical protein ASF22_02595 [Methylobacterium sp. Leaf87]